MKKILLSGILIFSVMLSVSCDKGEEIDIAYLEGAWSIANDDPNLVVDGLVLYTFGTDKTCSVYVYDALSGKDTTMDRRYVLSIDQRLITMYKENPLQQENDIYTQQYYIRKLNWGEMRWENASPSDGNPLYIKFLRAR